MAAACLMAGWAWIACAARAEEPAAAQQARPADNPQEVQRREQLKQLTTHWEAQLTKLLHAHLELIRALCGDLSVETRRAIVQAGQRALKDGAVAAATAQLGGKAARQNKGGRGPADTRPADEPAERLAAALEKILAEHVGAAEAAAFAAELATRRERWKKATVDMCVAMLDGQLSLTAVQREAIGRSLLERWQDGMFVTLHQVHVNNGRMMFPGVPKDCIVPHLDEVQRQVYAAAGNVSVGVGNGPMLHMLGRVHSQLPRDPWWFP